MKIISWNVNGLRAIERKGNLKEFIETHQPDVWCIQETKSKPEQVAFLETDYSQYAQFYHSAEKPGYSGVSIWVRNDLELDQVPQFIAGMPNNPVNNEGRIARIDLGKTSILGVYFPNGGKSEQAWADKLVFYEKFLDSNPDLADVYSWWHMITRSRAKNVGWRIDYFFVDEKDFSSIKNIEYLTDQMGSDHCPVSLEM